MSESNQTPPSSTPPSDRGQSRPPVDPAAMTPPAPPSYPPAYYPAPPNRGPWRRIVHTILWISILLNLYLFFIVYWHVLAPAGPKVVEERYRDGDAQQRIVILPIQGMIDEGTYEFVHEALKALDKDTPKALVLRVDSPGGGVAASDRIWHELTAFKAKHKIPVVASYGSLAASGGYYVSAFADKIIAEPTTITGSIGVIAQAFTVEELLGKIGVKPEVVTSTASTNKDSLNPMRNWTEKDRDLLRGILDNAYTKFVEVVTTGRSGKLSQQQVKELATGQVFTAKQAEQNGLIDQQGYLDQALEQASTLAGISKDVAQVNQIVPAPRGLLGAVLGASSQAAPAITTEQLRRWAVELSTPAVEYRLRP